MGVSNENFDSPFEIIAIKGDKELEEKMKKTKIYKSFYTNTNYWCKNTKISKNILLVDPDKKENRYNKKMFLKIGDSWRINDLKTMQKYYKYMGWDNQVSYPTLKTSKGVDSFIKSTFGTKRSDLETFLSVSYKMGSNPLPLIRKKIKKEGYDFNVSFHREESLLEYDKALYFEYDSMEKMSNTLAVVFDYRTTTAKIFSEVEILSWDLKKMK